MKTFPLLALFLSLLGCQQASLPAPASAASAVLTPSAQPVDTAKAIDPIHPDLLWKLSVTPAQDQTYLIHVADAQGKEVQVIEDVLAPDGAPKADWVKLVDVNGDGLADVVALGPSIGASALSSNAIYLFDPATKKFVESDDFDHDAEVRAEPKGCIIRTYRNDDNMTYSNDRYCWSDGKWVAKGNQAQ